MVLDVPASTPMKIERIVMMKAIRLLEWGQPVQVEDLPIPQPGDDDILVRVHATSLNPVDGSIVSGRLQGMLTVPLTLGTDFAGEVVRVGSQVKHVQEASAVYGMIPFRGGTFAEYVLAKASEVAPKPARLDFVQAAAVPLTALTAWQALFDVAHLQAGERVLVLGAAGGVGSFAVQFAKRKGAVVIGMASAQDEAFVRQDLGLDQAILPQDGPFEDVVTDCDVVLNVADPALSPRAYRTLKPGGRLVSSVGEPPQEEAERLGIQASSFYAQPHVDQLREIAAWIDAGDIVVRLDSTFPLHQAQAALERKQREKTQGKIVLQVN
jgi:NADPH:quinone reductase-like Zn-dependent oxidoreductase